MADAAVDSALRRLGRESVSYGIGLALVQLASFLLLPILTRVLSTAEYGVVSIALTTGTFVSTLVSAGIAAALFRSYYDHTTSRGRGQVVWTSLVITVMTSVSALVIGWALSPVASHALFGDRSLAYLVVAVIAEAGLRAVTSACQSVLRAESRPAGFIAVNLVSLLVRFVLTWGLLSVYGLGLRGYAIGTVVGGVAGLLLALVLISRDIRPDFSISEARLLIRYGGPVMTANFASAVLVGADRYFLRLWHGLEVVAVYNVGYQLASIVVVLLVTPISTAWPTIMLPLKDKPEIRSFISASLTIVVGLSGWLVVALAFVGPVLVRVVAPPEYSAAAIVLPIVALANSMLLVQRVIASGPELTRRMNRYSVPFVIAAVVVVVLDLALIPKWGMYGATAATLTAYVLLPVLAYIAGRRIYPIQYQWVRLGALVAATVPLTASGIWYGQATRGNGPLSCLGAVLGLVVYPIVLIGLRIVDRADVRRLFEVLRQRKPA